MKYVQVDEISLKYDNQTKRTNDQDGVSVSVPYWGNPCAVENVDETHQVVGNYFSSISNMLANDLGFEKGKTILAAPYDYRKGPGMDLIQGPQTNSKFHLQSNFSNL